MNKDSVFFSIHSNSPKSSQRFYYQSNKFDSNNLLNYIIDAHSFDDIGSKPFSLLNSHSKEIFDVKKGLSTFEQLEKPHKQSHIFSGIVSFDEELSKRDIFSTHWQDIASLIFQTFIQAQDFKYADWEMQANMHYNTNNKHLQFRIYQNQKTKEEDIYKVYWISNNTIKSIKQNIYNYIEKNLDKFPVNFPHILKGKSIRNYNTKIKENKNLIMDFVNLINMKSIDSKEDKEKVNEISNLYYSRVWFDKWIEENLYFLDLSAAEKNQIREIIKNNIANEIFDSVQSLKYHKAFDYIVKKDPRDKENTNQKFKNFDKINQNTTFEKLASYQPQTIKVVYKEPMSRFIEEIMSRNQYNIGELEQAIGNYLRTIRPNLINNISLDKLKYKYIKITPIKSLVPVLQKFYKDNNLDNLNEIVTAYFDQNWFKYWMAITLGSFNLNPDQKETITNIIKNNIKMCLYNKLSSQNNQKQNQHDVNSLKTIWPFFAENKPKELNNLINRFSQTYLKNNWLISQLKDWCKNNNVSDNVLKLMLKPLLISASTSILLKLKDKYKDIPSPTEKQFIEIFEEINNQDNFVWPYLNKEWKKILETNGLSNLAPKLKFSSRFIPSLNSNDARSTKSAVSSVEAEEILRKYMFEDLFDSVSVTKEINDYLKTTFNNKDISIVFTPPNNWETIRTTKIK